MRQGIRYSLYLLIISIVIIFASVFPGTRLFESLSNLSIVCLTAAFCSANIVFIVIFYIGQKKDSGTRTFYTLVSITAKFLIELIIALMWFLIGKKTSIPSVILFFVLYLSFTLFSISVILKTLKKNSL